MLARSFSWPERLRRALAAPLQGLLPTPCLFCGAARTRDGICSDCREDLPGQRQPRCPVCAIDLEAVEICGGCLRRRPFFDRTRAAFSYAFPLDSAIQRLKYARDLTLATPLGALLADLAASEPRPDLLVPMPLSRARLRSRGFNQAVELARVITRRHGHRMARDLVRRAKDGPPQASLPWAERAGNVRGAFACDADLTDLRIVVVDDVMTSGATLEELARTLKRAGAREVTAWVLARTPRASP